MKQATGSWQEIAEQRERELAEEHERLVHSMSEASKWERLAFELKKAAEEGRAIRGCECEVLREAQADNMRLKAIIDKLTTEIRTATVHVPQGVSYCEKHRAAFIHFCALCDKEARQ